MLVCLWPIPDDALCKFLFHFYMALQKANFVTQALKDGVAALQGDDR